VKNTTSKNDRNNWISVDLSYFATGIGVRYEHIFSSKMSFGTYFFWNTYPDFFGDFVGNGIEYDFYGINAFFRFYPWGKIFYINGALGLMYNFHSLLSPKGCMVYQFEPSVGWKIPFDNGFFIQPSLVIYIMLRDFEYYASNTRFSIGIGYAF